MKYLNLLILLIFSLFLQESTVASDIGKRYPSEKKEIKDSLTGIKITFLTTSDANDQKLYQTHPQWTSDGKHIIFRSNRSGDRQQAFAYEEETGEIIQLTSGSTGTGSLNVARKSNKIYYFRGRRGEQKKLIELNLDMLFADSKSGKMKDSSYYERIITILPDSLRESGGFTLDMNEKVAYIGITKATDIPEGRIDTAQMRRRTGVAIPQRPGGIRKIDLESGKMSMVINTPFTMGHVQANPWVSGEILFCNETGGDAKQRMWITNDSDKTYRPLYIETLDEWVTHEVYIDKDHVLFNVMAHLSRLRTKPTGIFCVNVRTNEMIVVGQIEAGRGFWHCAGTDDGLWAAGDNFDGSVYIIDRITGEKNLVTTGHLMKPDHAHPNFSPDKKRLLIQSGMLSNGKTLDLAIVELPINK